MAFWIFVGVLAFFLILYLLRAIAPRPRAPGMNLHCPTCNLPFPRTLPACPDCAWRPEGTEVVLAAAGPDAEATAKKVRELTGLPLSEARAIVKGAPRTLKCGVPPEEAARLRDALGTVGARAELRDVPPPADGGR